MLMNPTEGSSGQEIDVIYKTKRANILGRYVLFLLQNDAGPCALLAICNVLLLQNMLNLHPDTTEIASSKLLHLLEKRIHDIKRSIDVEGLQQSISEAFELLPCLATGLNADVCLKKFCDLLDIRLVHEGDIQESLEVPSHSHQHLRIGDIQEEFELELAMRLSEDKNPPTKDESTMQIPSKTGKEDLIKKPENALSSAQNSHGCLQEGLSVSYRNNHFNTMFEHGGEFYLLVTDQRCLNRSRLVWEKLNVEFPSSQQGDISRQVETSTSTDQELARVLQQLVYLEDEASGLEGTSTDSEDLEFAIFLQQLEFTERARRS